MLRHGPIRYEDLAELEEEAIHTLHRLRYEQQKRAKSGERFPPLVLEFAGSPKSGKTTTINIVQHFLRRMDFNVISPPEGASKRNLHHLRQDLVAYNTVALNYAISELLEAYYNVDTPDVIILDRGIFDSLAWVGMLQTRRLINRRQ